jgi:hypothetical protein
VEIKGSFTSAKFCNGNVCDNNMGCTWLGHRGCAIAATIRNDHICVTSSKADKVSLVHAVVIGVPQQNITDVNESLTSTMTVLYAVV